MPTPINRQASDRLYRNIGGAHKAAGDFLGPLSWMVGIRPSENGPVRPSQPTGQPAMNNYTVSGVKYDRKTGQAINPDTGKISSGGYSIDPSNGNRTDYAPGADRGAGRNVTRVSPTGVVQKGTQTSPASTPINMDKGFDQLLAEMGLTNYYNGQAFTSNQLPQTASNPFSANNTPKTAAFNPAAPGVTGNTYDNYGSEGGASAASQDLIDGNEEFNPNAKRIEGASDAPKRRSLKEALSDTSGMVVKSENLDNLRARAAFLDADNRMDGLKRAQAIRDKMVYAGGQHYIADGDGKRAISTDEARSISNGKQTAAGLLQTYKDKITASNAQKPTEAADTGTTPQQAAESGAFKQDKPIVATNNTNPGPAIDFNNNNNQAAPEFDTETDLLGGSRVKLPMNRNIWGG
jgi:hypothetical protein